MYHAARSAFAVADEAGIETVATYLWAIRDGYGTARPSEMAAALVNAAADHGAEAVNLGCIAICEQSSDQKRYWLVVEALLQVRDLQSADPHGWQGCRRRQLAPRASPGQGQGDGTPSRLRNPCIAPMNYYCVTSKSGMIRMVKA